MHTCLVLLYYGIAPIVLPTKSTTTEAWDLGSFCGNLASGTLWILPPRTVNCGSRSIVSWYVDIVLVHYQRLATESQKSRVIRGLCLLPRTGACVSAPAGPQA